MIPFGAEHRDDPDYLAWLNDREVVRTLYLRDYLDGVSYEMVAGYVDDMMASEHNLMLALYDLKDSKFVGSIKAGHIDWDARIAEIGIMIGAKDYWGRGLATDSIYTLSRYLFEQAGFRRLVAGAMSINGGMIAVFEKLGFRREACFRQHDRIDDGYCDHIYLGCFRDELTSPY